MLAGTHARKLLDQGEDQQKVATLFKVGRKTLYREFSVALRRFGGVSESALLGDCGLWYGGLLNQSGDLSLAFSGLGPAGVRYLDRRSTSGLCSYHCVVFADPSANLERPMWGTRFRRSNCESEKGWRAADGRWSCAGCGRKAEVIRKVGVSEQILYRWLVLPLI